MRFSLAHARLAPRENSLPHKLLQSSKVYYVLEGQGIMHVEDQKCVVEPGHTFFIPPGALQWIENTGSGCLAFLVLVDPPWRQNDEEVMEPVGDVL